jgi:uncharacterized membrane protein YvbJ
MTCPECGSTDVRTSTKSNWRDAIHQPFGQEAFRCRRCRHRFYASASAETIAAVQAHQSTRKHHQNNLMSARARKRLVRRAVVITIFLLAFLIFWFFLQYLTKEPSSPQDPKSMYTPVAALPAAVA